MNITRTLTTLCREAPVAGRRIHDANIVATILRMAKGAC